MRKRFLLCSLFLLLGLPLLAQSTNVTATITDSTGQVWANGTYSITWVPNPNQPGPYYWQGAKFVPQVYTGVLDAYGTMALTLPDSNTITPTGSAWSFVLCANTTAPCSTVTIPVTGSTEDLGSLFSARVTPPFIFAVPMSRAYSSNEVAIPPPSQGGQFYNVSNNTPYFWTGSTWHSIAQGNSVPSPFQVYAASDPMFGFASTPGGSNYSAITSPTPGLFQFGNGTAADISGSIHAGSVNSIKDALGFPGSDIGMQVNAAFAACTSGCEVDVPAGSYSFPTTINVPRMANTAIKLKCDAGSTLTYTGTGDAITNSEPITGVGNSIVTIEGCTVFGGAAGNGIHLYPGNQVRLVGNLVYGFTGGEGLLDDGSEVVKVTDDWFLGNQIGILEEGSGCTTSAPITCSNANYLVNGYTSYAPNALHAEGGASANNTEWGVEVTGGGLNNSYIDLDFEGNGTAGSAYGAVLDAHSVGDSYERNYFENSPHYLVLGTSSTPASGTQVLGNYATVPNTSGYTFELVNANTPTVSGNVENSTGSFNTCFINVTTANYVQVLRNTINAANQFCTSGGAGTTNTTFFYTDTNNWLHLTHLVSPQSFSFQSQTGFAFNNSTGAFQNFGCGDTGVCTFAGSAAEAKVSGPVSATAYELGSRVVITSTMQDEYDTISGCNFATDGANLTCTNTVTLTNAMPDTNYVVECTEFTATAVGSVILDNISPVTTTTTSYSFTEMTQGSSTIFPTYPNYGKTYLCHAHHG